MNVLLLDPFESNIPGEITHSLLQEATQENKFKGSESTCFISFDSTGNSLAAGTRDGRTLIWDLNGFSIKKTLVGHVAPVTCLDWHSLDRDSLVQNDLDPDHKLHSILKPPSASSMDTNKEELLVSGSSDWNVILWNPKTGARRDTLRFTSPVLTALLQPYTPAISTKSAPPQDLITPTSATSAAAADKGESSKPPSKGKGKQHAKKTKASSSKDTETNPSSVSNVYQQPQPPKIPAPPIRLAVIAQGQKPILLERIRSSGTSSSNSSWKRTFLELPESSGATNASSAATAASSIVACCMQFSRDGKFLFVGTNKGTVAIFSPVSGKLLSTLKVTPSSIVKQIIFSRSGLDMIVNSSDRVIRLYSVESVDEENEDGEAGEEEPAPEIEAEGKFLDSVDRIQWFDCCISADGEYVVGAKQGGDKHDLYIWDKKTGVLTKQLSGPPDGMMGMTWHPSRPVCATISGYYGCVYLWRHTPQQKFSAYEPTFTELEDNQEYAEKETEFDIVEEKETMLAEEDMSGDLDIMEVEV